MKYAQFFEGRFVVKTDLKKIKIAVYSGKKVKKAQKDEIYHLNLSIYVPKDNTKHAASTQKEGMK